MGFREGFFRRGEPPPPLVAPVASPLTQMNILSTHLIRPLQANLPSHTGWWSRGNSDNLILQRILSTFSNCISWKESQITGPKYTSGTLMYSLSQQCDVIWKVLSQLIKATTHFSFSWATRWNRPCTTWKNSAGQLSTGAMITEKKPLPLPSL